MGCNICLIPKMASLTRMTKSRPFNCVWCSLQDNFEGIVWKFKKNSYQIYYWTHFTIVAGRLIVGTQNYKSLDYIMFCYNMKKMRKYLLRTSPKRYSIMKFQKLYIWNFKMFFSKRKTPNLTSKLFVLYIMVLILVIINLNS